MPEFYRILFEGERQLGSNAGSSARALRRLGHTVMDMDHSAHVPVMWTGLSLRAARRLLMPLIIDEYNRKILQLAREFKPNIFLAFKGMFVLPRSLMEMRSLGIALYNFYPDVSAFTHKVSFLPRALQEYDCVFSTKKFTAKDLERQGYPLRNVEFLPHGYDPDIHFPVEINHDEQEIYGTDVTFIGTHLPGKERLLEDIRRPEPKLDLTIWGNGWERAKAHDLLECIRGRALLGVEYAKGLCASKIALGLLSEKVPGASSGDRITSRTFNIPATGSFMIHERNEEVLEYYEEGREIECFSSVEELAEKIRFYLARPDKKKAIAEAGYKRCVPAYSQDNRMKAILDWHKANARA
jgi:glycosyltransferase involved in cell wall biosynthesis